MVEQKTISLVIPCLNEAAAIPAVVPQLRMTLEALNQLGWKFEVLVVDDGSTDGSDKILAQHPDILRVICHSQNLGYGQALKTGFAQAKGELIAMMDMDATYDPLDILILLKHMQDENLDVVFGNRMLPQSEISLWRRFGNNLFGFCFKHFLKLPEADVCSGLRLFKNKFVPKILEMPYRGFNLSIAMSAMFLTKSSKCQQIPISYSVRLGDSKLLSWVEGWTHLYVIFHQWLQRNRT